MHQVIRKYERKSSIQRRRTDRHAPPVFLQDHQLVSEHALKALAGAIRRYQAIAAAGGWKPLNKGTRIKAGDTGAQVKRLRRRLAMTGDLAVRQVKRGSATFDPQLVKALKRFQVRHGLTPSGRMNRLTVRALNVSAAVRLEQLLQSRQRIASLLTLTKGTQYVLVNIPAYELQAVRNDKVELASRVVVGKPTTPTPVIVASIRALNPLPYWHVPESIARRQLIPALKKDPKYLAKQRIRVFASWGGTEIDPRQVNWWAPQGQRYVFRQEPGPQNALGLVRVDMPNKHIVYMHDTPLKKLYNYYLRPYSAGCIRVQRVFELADWLRRNDGQDVREGFRQIVDRAERQTIKLARPVPIYLVYINAWASQPSVAHFRRDIYQHGDAGPPAPVTQGWTATVQSVMP